MNNCGERLKNGIITENPIFVLMLGMCPTLAVTTSAINGIGMGLSTTVVLVMSNMLISMLRKIIPDSVRMPAFIVVVASFVTIVQFLMEGFTPSLYDSLGIYIPFGAQIIPVADAATGSAGYTPITIFILAPGAFLVLAGLAAIQNKVKINMAKKGKDVSKIQSGCGSNCATCGGCPSEKE